MTDPIRPPLFDPPLFDPPLFDFVPIRARRDGWTPLRQARFVFELCATGCVDEACRRVGLSQQSAYRLRDRPDAASFRAAWLAALDRPLPVGCPMARAVDGIATPIMYAGRQVGERRRHDNRLAKYILRIRRPAPAGVFAKTHPSRRTGALAALRRERLLFEGERADGQLPALATADGTIAGDRPIS